MQLSRSSFYYKPKGNGSERMKAEADLRDRIEAICLEFPRYGYRRVTHQLKHERWQVNHFISVPLKSIERPWYISK